MHNNKNQPTPATADDAMSKEHKADELGLDWIYCADNYKDAAVDIYNLRNKADELQGKLDLAVEALE